MASPANNVDPGPPNEPDPAADDAFPWLDGKDFLAQCVPVRGTLVEAVSEGVGKAFFEVITTNKFVSGWAFKKWRMIRASPHALVTQIAQGLNNKVHICAASPCTLKKEALHFTHARIIDPELIPPELQGVDGVDEEPLAEEFGNGPLPGVPNINAPAPRPGVPNTGVAQTFPAWGASASGPPINVQEQVRRLVSQFPTLFSPSGRALDPRTELQESRRPQAAEGGAGSSNAPPPTSTNPQVANLLDALSTLVSSDKDFPDGPGTKLKTRTRIMRVHAARPGALYQELLDRQQELMGTVGNSGSFRSYIYQFLIAPLGATKIGVRSLRELKTIALALDYISDRRIKSLSDVLAQRFLALELSIQTNSWQHARWLELIPPESTGLLQTTDLVEARKYEKLLHPKKGADSSSDDEPPPRPRRKAAAAKAPARPAAAVKAPLE
ncbi:MAG: hypothetical protein HRU27_20935 [Rhizobiaceae bacterium]|nr:hypothetical protein [Rhizobiaceae bacterium]